METSTTNANSTVKTAQNAKTVAVQRKDSYSYKFDQLSIVAGFNVRKDYGNIQELTDSIRENGLMVPLRGHYVDGKIVITDGHRRYEALSILDAEGIDMNIPVIIEDRSTNDADRVFAMLLTNSGKPLTAVEQAEAVTRLVAYGFKGVEIARKLGKAPAEISNLITLASAPQEVKNAVTDGSVSPTTAVAVVRQAKGNDEVAVKAVKDAKANAGTGAKKVTGKAVLNKKSPVDLMGDLFNRLDDENAKNIVDDLTLFIKGQINLDDAVANLMECLKK